MHRVGTGSNAFGGNAGDSRAHHPHVTPVALLEKQQQSSASPSTTTF